MAIDVGALCDDRGATQSNNTFVEKENPANATGTIDSVCVFANSEMGSIEYASIIDEGSEVYSTNGDTDGTELTATGETTHTAAGDDFTAFAIESEQFIAIKWSGGNLERDNAGYAGASYATTAIPFTDVQFTFESGRTHSIYGTGAEAGGAIEITSWFAAQSQLGLIAKPAWYINFLAQFTYLKQRFGPSGDEIIGAITVAAWMAYQTLRNIITAQPFGRMGLPAKKGTLKTRSISTQHPFGRMGVSARGGVLKARSKLTSSALKLVVTGKAAYGYIKSFITTAGAKLSLAGQHTKQSAVSHITVLVHHFSLVCKHGTQRGTSLIQSVILVIGIVFFYAHHTLRSRITMHPFGKIGLSAKKVVSKATSQITSLALRLIVISKATVSHIRSFITTVGAKLSLVAQHTKQSVISYIAVLPQHFILACGYGVQVMRSWIPEAIYVVTAWFATQTSRASISSLLHKILLSPLYTVQKAVGLIQPLILVVTMTTLHAYQALVSLMPSTPLKMIINALKAISLARTFITSLSIRLIINALRANSLARAFIANIGGRMVFAAKFGVQKARTQIRAFSLKLKFAVHYAYSKAASQIKGIGFYYTLASKHVSLLLRNTVAGDFVLNVMYTGITYVTDSLIYIFRTAKGKIHFKTRDDE